MNLREAMKDESLKLPPMEVILYRIRRMGWVVGAHNDYFVDSKSGTIRSYWMFTHSDGYFVEGDGEHDFQALQECLEKIEKRQEMIKSEGMRRF